MKKIIALLLSCAMCFALLTACGSNGSTSSNKGGSAAGASLLRAAPLTAA